MALRIIIVENTHQATGSVRSIVAAMQELRGVVEPIFVGPRNPYIVGHGFRQIEMEFIALRRHPQTIAYPLALVRNALQLARIVETSAIDLVHVNDLYNMVGIAARPLLGAVPVVYHVRLLKTSYLRPIYDYLAWCIIHGATSVLAVSRAVAADLPSSPRVAVVYDGLRIPPVQPPPPKRGKTVEVVYVGNYIPGKGHEHALRALHIAVRRAPCLRLSFVGGTLGRPENEAYLEGLSALAEGLGVSSYVTFQAETDDVATVMERADVVLNLSESESFSMVCLEGMAAGRPVVASRCGGPEELLASGRAGLLVKNRCPNEAAEALVRLAADAELRETMGAQGHREALECFDTGTTAAVLLGEYRKAISSIRSVTLA